MTKLKTLKGFGENQEAYELKEELQEAAIEWIKVWKSHLPKDVEFRILKKEINSYVVADEETWKKHPILDRINIFAYFFNITEEDLK